MNFLRFLLSKTFFIQVIFIALASILLFIVLYFGLIIFTNHKKYQKVPNLVGIPLSDVSKIIQKEGLRFEVIDSARFVPSMKPFSVLSQIPVAEHEVKENRKIYLTVNPSGFRKITVPNLIQITKRNAESLIKSTGFEVGVFSYRDDIGKDMVLEIQFDGKKIEPGILLPKTSKLDLVLGNGKR